MLDKVYNPHDVEDRIYEGWMSRGHFHAAPDPAKTPFTIVIPPPNITGQLHMGHALDNTIQDVLIRWRRMQGYCTLWMPGTDHASIATEAKIVEALEDEDLTKEGLGREAFLKRAWEWRDKYGGRIVEQLKRLGCSCDWERERFTMDEGLSAAVIYVFVKLYEDGLIYKGERIINWCPGCGTSISDIEVEYSERDDHFWYMRYPIIGSPGEYIVVATTRPETMLGDTAVAVNPDDPRYQKYIGKKALLPLMDRELPIIADSYVDSELGSGAVKITPAHDPNDFEVGLRHGLEQIRVIDDAANMNENAGPYHGMTRNGAREKIVKDLEALGLIDKIESIVHNVGECSRCQQIIEPLISMQWFVKMKPLAEPAIEVVKAGKTRFVPERFSRIYYNWMENIQDWCISRQLWWGHRIPAYYCGGCGDVVVTAGAPGEAMPGAGGEAAPGAGGDAMPGTGGDAAPGASGVWKCGKCGGELRQDEDVLDTWFSSALWPFSTLGWPEKTEDFNYFYPTDVLVTGYDIIFFWVARMIFSGVRHTGAEPFKYVYIHGMIRDDKGKKMSKSAGNGIDPLDVVDSHGADALRFALTIGNAPGNDLRLTDDKVKAARNFANKLWNASRFVLAHLSGDAGGGGDAGSGGGAGGAGGGDAGENMSTNAPLAVRDADLTAIDRWILSQLNDHIKEINDNLDKFELGLALQKIYDFIWDVFCDWYIEFVKPRLNAPGQGAPGQGASGQGAPGQGASGQGAPGGQSADKNAVLLTLRYVLIQSLKLLHPFMPFITEEIYASVRDGADISGPDGLSATMSAAGKKDSLMIDEWPVYEPRFDAPGQTGRTALVIDVIRAIRNMRSEKSVPPSRKLSGVFVAADPAHAEALEEGRVYIERLAGLRPFDIAADKGGVSAGGAAIVAGGVEAFFPLGELIDIPDEIKRLEKELAGLINEIERAQSKLDNPGFTGKAPPQVVEEERQKLVKYAETRDKVEENIKRLRDN